MGREAAFLIPDLHGNFAFAEGIQPRGGRLAPAVPSWMRVLHPPPLSPSPPPRSPIAAPSCRPLLVATYNPEEGALREHLLDRIAVTLSADVPQSFDDRVRAIDAAMRFQDRAKDVFAETDELTEALKTSVRNGEGGRGGEGVARVLWVAGGQGACSIEEVGDGHCGWRAEFNRALPSALKAEVIGDRRDVPFPLCQALLMGTLHQLSPS